MSIPDLYSNHIGTVLSIAPTTVGRFAQLAQTKRVSLYQDKQDVGEALSRWLFADFPQKSTDFDVLKVSVKENARKSIQNVKICTFRWTC